MNVLVSANFPFKMLCCGRNENSGCGSQIIQIERLIGNTDGVKIADFSSCLNLRKDNGLLRCSRLRCDSIIGSYENRASKNVLVMNVRELIFAPIMSYSLNSINTTDTTLRVFFTDVLDGVKNVCRRNLNVNRFILVPISDENKPGVVTPQVSRPPPKYVTISRGESSASGSMPRLKVRSFASEKLFGSKEPHIVRPWQGEGAVASTSAVDVNSGVSDSKRKKTDEGGDREPPVPASVSCSAVAR